MNQLILIGFLFVQIDLINRSAMASPMRIDFKKFLFLKLYVYFYVIYIDLDLHGKPFELPHYADDEASLKQHFNSFKQEHRPKGYASVQHQDGAFEKFKKNVASINEQNEAYKNGSVTWCAKVNRFSDLVIIYIY